MIVLRQYNLVQNRIVAQIGCNCGKEAVSKTVKAKTTWYHCRSCGSRATLSKLKQDAGALLRSRKEWTVYTEKREQKRWDINIPVDIALASLPGSSTILGIAVDMSEKGLAVIAVDVNEDLITMTQGEDSRVEISFASQHPLFSLKNLKARIVYVYHRDYELPCCRVGVVFDSLSKKEREDLDKCIALLKEKEAE